MQDLVVICTCAQQNIHSHIRAVYSVFAGHYMDSHSDLSLRSAAYMNLGFAVLRLIYSVHTKALINRK